MISPMGRYCAVLSASYLEIEQTSFSPLTKNKTVPCGLAAREQQKLWPEKGQGLLL